MARVELEKISHEAHTNVGRGCFAVSPCKVLAARIALQTAPVLHIWLQFGIEFKDTSKFWAPFATRPKILPPPIPKIKSAKNTPKHDNSLGETG